jgi:hypothetical protein
VPCGMPAAVSKPCMLLGVAVPATLWALQGMRGTALAEYCRRAPEVRPEAGVPAVLEEYRHGPACLLVGSYITGGQSHSDVCRR